MDIFTASTVTAKNLSFVYAILLNLHNQCFSHIETSLLISCILTDWFLYEGNTGC